MTSSVGRADLGRLRPTLPQLVLAGILLALLAGLLVSSISAQNDAREHTAAFSRTEASSTNAMYSMRESLNYTTAVQQYLLGQVPRRSVQIARALLAQRLSVVDENGRDGADAAGPAYHDALGRLDLAVAALPPGVGSASARQELSPQLTPLVDSFDGAARRLLDTRSAEYRIQSQDYAEALVRSRILELVLLVGSIAVAATLLGWIAGRVRRTHLESREALAREEANLTVARDQLDRMSSFDRSQARVLELIATDATLTSVLTATADAASVRCGGLPVRIRWDHLEVCRPMGARIPADAEVAWIDSFGSRAADAGRGEIAVVGRPDQLDADMLSGAARCRDLARLGVERDRTSHRLAFQATHDALTGLTNRSVLLDELAEQLNLSARTGCGLAVLFCNLDSFAVVNDSLGHDVGDLLLIEAAARLRAVMRDADIVGRHGGDEFVVLSPILMDVRDAVDHAEQIRAALCDPYLIDGHALSVGASIGVAYADDEALGRHDLVRAADLAMRRAKAQGGSRVSVFDDELDAHARTLADMSLRD